MSLIIIKKINEIFIQISSDTNTILDLQNYFTFEVPGSKFTPLYKRGLWDGKIKLFKVANNLLYLGLLNMLLEYCRSNNHTVDMQFTLPNNNYTYEQIESYIASLNLYGRGVPITIREYQINAVLKVLNQEKVLLVSPTSSGKSMQIYAMLRWYLQKNLKVLIIVPSQSLVEQLYKDFEDYSSHNGFVVSEVAQKLYSGFSKVFEKDILITTYQSIYKNPKEWYKAFGVVIVDECHQATANSFKTILENCTDIRYRIGTTGTLTGMKVHTWVLEGLIGSVYKVITTRELIDANNIVDLNITCLMLKHSEEVRKNLKKTLNAQYAKNLRDKSIQYKDEIKWIAENVKRSKFIRNLAISLKGTTLILFQFVESHGQVLYDLLKENLGDSRPLYFMHGKVDVDDREIARKLLETDSDAIIVASYGTFSTGINIPSIENIIFASPSKSRVRNLQSIGRGLRLKEGKTCCNLYDISDDLHWKAWINHTLKHASIRYKLYSEEQFKVKLVEVSI